jgi:RsiW-degrading membrane proteinase PrsW (M82 family)
MPTIDEGYGPDADAPMEHDLSFDDIDAIEVNAVLTTLAPVRPERTPLAAWAVPVIAIGGSVLAILGSIIQEATALPILATFFVAPMVEESMKPVGLYILLAYRPEVLTSRFYTARLAAMAGAGFGAIESTVYVTVYVENPTPEFIAFRYTVPVLLHTVASFIFGFGINQRLKASMWGEVPFLSGNWPYFVAAIALHSAYNISVTALGLTGVLKF